MLKCLIVTNWIFDGLLVIIGIIFFAVHEGYGVVFKPSNRTLFFPLSVLLFTSGMTRLFRKFCRKDQPKTWSIMRLPPILLARGILYALPVVANLTLIILDRLLPGRALTLNELIVGASMMFISVGAGLIVESIFNTTKYKYALSEQKAESSPPARLTVFIVISVGIFFVICGIKTLYIIKLRST